jgi:outer membrane protein assembly factor BamB
MPSAAVALPASMLGGLLAWLVAMAPAPTASVPEVTRASARMRTPAPLWRLDGEGRGIPGARGSTVYFLGKRHEVIAVDGATGTIGWRAPTGGQGAETYGTSVLAIASVVVAGDYDLVGLDATDGRERWRFSPADGYGPGIYLGQATAGRVFAGSPAGRVYAVDATTGSCVWSVQPLSAAKTTLFAPVVSGDTVFAGYTTFGEGAGDTGGVIALDRATGREVWRRAFRPRSGGGSAAFGGGLVAVGPLVVASSGGGRIHALDASTGAVRWSLPSVRRPGPAADRSERDLRPLAAAGRMLYAGSLTGTVVAYDIGARQERWRYADHSRGSTGPRIAADGDTVYVPHLGGVLVALEAATGTERWHIGDDSSRFLWAPVLTPERMYLVASGGGLFAFAASGAGRAPVEARK